MATCRPIATRYLDLGLSLVLLRPSSKHPLPHPETGSWWQVSDPGALATALVRHPHANIALLCDGIVQVDIDSSDAMTWARARGLTSREVWVLRTARGWRVFYRAPDPCPPTHTDPVHQTPDLLASGRLALVPPSRHPNGYAYTWAGGHSPFDLVPSDLAHLPDPILTAWRKLKAAPPTQRRHASSPRWLVLVFETICNHLTAAGHQLRQTRDGGVITTCPLHDDHRPSLSIHPDLGWKCWAGCGEGRLTLLAAHLGIRVREEVRK